MRTAAAVKGSPKYPLQRVDGLARPLGLKLNTNSHCGRNRKTARQRKKSIFNLIFHRTHHSRRRDSRSTSTRCVYYFPKRGLSSFCHTYTVRSLLVYLLDLRPIQMCERLRVYDSFRRFTVAALVYTLAFFFTPLHARTHTHTYALSIFFTPSSCSSSGDNLSFHLFQGTGSGGFAN